MSDNYEIEKTSGNEITKSSIQGFLGLVRPVWKGKGLIKRVKRLLPVDPSSACQRLLNAAIFDLREKVVIIGIDIAKEVAKNYRLPPIEKEEDILENYSTFNLIDLSYRIGILRRPEWRRIQRCYEIRKDLEHEDNEYEAVLEDCFYIFKSSIEIVLAQDPIETLKVTDVKQIVTEPQRITVTEELLQDYEHAPELRQREIQDFLISNATDSNQPELVNENAFELLRHFRPLTKTSVTIESAKKIEHKLGRNPVDVKTACLSHAVGATPYFKSTKIADFYALLEKEFKSSTSSWGAQSEITKIFHDIGHFIYCPPTKVDTFLKYLVLWYIGTPGGYGDWGRNRAVFYSNGAAPVIAKILQYRDINIYDKIEKLREDNDVSYHLDNRHISNRFESLLDFADRQK